MARPRNRLLPLLGTALLLLAAVAGAAEAEDTSEADPGCRYVQAGLPGPRGNALLIDAPMSHIVLRRQAEAILVVFSHPRGEPVLDCEGPEATVRNVDRILYRPPAVAHVGHRLAIDERDGLLQPGASPEAGGDEVEVFAEFPEEPGHKWSSIFVTGTVGSDRIRIGGLRYGRTGVNLDVLRDGAHLDADVVVTAARRAHFQLEGGPGNDRLVAGGRGAEFVGSMIQWSLSMRGEAGDDLVIGGPQRDVVRGDEGEDLIFGRGGRDRLNGDEGDDRLYGGPGDDDLTVGSDAEVPFHDLLAGGPDHDTLHSIDGNRDKVICGSGPDQAYADATDDWDRATCEKLHGPDF
jgi:RTX calcium-binding nonapeptide repeat (4 copies)